MNGYLRSYAYSGVSRSGWNLFVYKLLTFVLTGQSSTGRLGQCRDHFLHWVWAVSSVISVLWYGDRTEGCTYTGVTIQSWNPKHLKLGDWRGPYNSLTVIKKTYKMLHWSISNNRAHSKTLCNWLVALLSLSNVSLCCFPHEKTQLHNTEQYNF